jgi:uncharacterized membrane protein
MTAFDVLKIVHVISACVLFGTGAGTAFYMFYVNLKKDVYLIAHATRQVVIADWLFTGSSGVVQALTGFAMIGLQGYAFSLPWVWISILGYCIAGACWLPVVWLQMRCRDLAFEALKNKTALPKAYHQYFKAWVILGVPAFLALVVVYYMMTNQPMHF